MLNILFWNLKNNPIDEYISNCIIENEVDIATFSEVGGIHPEKIEEKLANLFHFVRPVRSEADIKVRLLVKNGIEATPVQEKKRYGLFRISTAIETYLLAVIHLEDKWSSKSNNPRLHTIQELIKDLEESEFFFNCTKTIVIGDFNANPYDDELISMYAFNSVLFKSVIMRSEIREHDSRLYKRFYNPILDFISEANEMYGSFYRSCEDNTPYWNCLDQVIIRKNLIGNLCKVSYLKSVGNTSLIKEIAPNSDISDHLPLLIMFKEVETDE